VIVFATGLPPNRDQRPLRPSSSSAFEIGSTKPFSLNPGARKPGADALAENRPAKIGATSSSFAAAVSAFSLREEQRRGWSCRSALNGRVAVVQAAMRCSPMCVPRGGDRTNSSARPLPV